MAKVRHRPEIALTRLELAELIVDRYPDERAEALEHPDFAIIETLRHEDATGPRAGHCLRGRS